MVPESVLDNGSDETITRKCQRIITVIFVYQKSYDVSSLGTTKIMLLI